MNAVIFDFDGTIADSFDEVLAFLCSQCNRDPRSISPEEHAALRGLSMRQLALQVGVSRWRLPSAFFRGKARLSRRMHRILPFAGVPEALAALHGEQYRMYIISSNSKRNINRFLTQHGLSGYFVAVYGSAGWFGKGSVLKKALKKHKLAAASTVYVGDEARDIIAAKVAGMPSVAVNWGFGSEEQLLQYGPTIVVRKPAELQKALLEWGRTV